MSDFLSNLAGRSLGKVEVVRPRVPSLYEPYRRGTGSPGGRSESPTHEYIADAEEGTNTEADAAPFRPARGKLPGTTPRASGNDNESVELDPLPPLARPQDLIEPAPPAIVPHPVPRPLRVASPEHPIRPSTTMEPSREQGADSKTEPLGESKMTPAGESGGQTIQPSTVVPLSHEPSPRADELPPTATPPSAAPGGNPQAARPPMSLRTAKMPESARNDDEKDIKSDLRTNQAQPAPPWLADADLVVMHPTSFSEPPSQFPGNRPFKDPLSPPVERPQAASSLFPDQARLLTSQPIEAQSLSAQPKRPSTSDIRPPTVPRGGIAPSPAADSQIGPPQTAVAVSIGKVEVRAVFPQPAVRPNPVPRPRTTVSLDDYLNQRHRGRR
jgi:hypothetical protein